MNANRIVFSCLAILVAWPAHAEIPGRLFFTPEQRAMLDSARRQNIQQTTEEQATLGGGVTFNGVVRRSDGRATLWINNRAVTGPEAASRFGAAQGGEPVLRLPYPGQSVGLRVGQSLDPVTGKAVEGYQERPKPTETPEAKATEKARKKPAPPETAAPPPAEPDTPQH